MTPYEIIAGPLTLWLAPVGTAFPLPTAAPAAAWVKVGTSGDRNYDEDGVTVQHVQKVETTRVAGATGPVAAFRTEEDQTVGVKLLDFSVEQYQLALAGVAPTTTAAAVAVPGTKKIGLSRGKTVQTYALLARGGSAYGDAFVGQYEVPRVYQSGSPKPVFKKGKPAGYELEFTSLEDMAAVNDTERFGRLVLQHQAPL